MEFVYQAVLEEGREISGIISRTIALIRKLGRDSCGRARQASGEKHRLVSSQLNLSGRGARR